MTNLFLNKPYGLGSILQKILFFAGALYLTSCQYQFGRGELSQSYSTLSVPYAEGDLKGELTADVVRKLSSSGAFRYVDSDGDLILKIKIIELNDENIGFRYDRKRTGQRKHNIVPTETRISIAAEVQIVEACSGTILRGPTRITASTDFDHTYYTTWDEINVFSMGQLSDIYEARDAVMHPLNRALAERIVDYVMNSW